MYLKVVDMHDMYVWSVYTLTYNQDIIREIILWAPILGKTNEVENKREVMGELVQAGAQVLSKFCHHVMSDLVVVTVLVCQLSPSPPHLCQPSPSQQLLLI